MEFKNSKLESMDDWGKFYGYASVFNVEDCYGDIVLNNAFQATLQKKRELPLLWQHDWDYPIGYIDKLREDYVGLYVEGHIWSGESNGNNAKFNGNSNKYEISGEIYGCVKNQLINGLSIGYRVNEANYDERGRRILVSVDLLEISVVAFPANRFSNIMYCKAANI